MRKGQRVHIVFKDITASLHSPDDLPAVLGEVCGWVLSAQGKEVKIATCRYFGKEHEEMDRITLLKGCIEKVEVI